MQRPRAQLATVKREKDELEKFKMAVKNNLTKTADVTRVELVDTGVPGEGRVSTAYVGETAYRAKAVILSTGSAWRPLGVPGE